MATYTYNPAVFEAPDLKAAQEIILTAEGDQSTEVRWARETPYLAGLLGEALDLKPGQMVVDYGCGVGRMSKALIERFDCRVLGVDISQKMRGLAPDYVGTPAFSVVSRRVFEGLIEGGFRADAAICVWVLQHCIKPAEDIGLLRRGLREGAPLGVVNTRGRAIPTVESRWTSDGLDVQELLRPHFPDIRTGELDSGVVGELIARHSFWGAYR